MNAWPKIKWTEARQIAELMDPKGTLPEEGVTPPAYFAQLRDAGELKQAVAYLGLALPRFEAIAWAAHVLEAEAKAVKPPRPDRQALDRTLRWLGEPIDEYRRAAWDAAEKADEDSPERLLGAAVFFSGGSLAPPELPAVNPPQDACGRMAAAAILSAAFRRDDPKSVLASALAAGEKVAEGGAQALSPP